MKVFVTFAWLLSDEQKIAHKRYVADVFTAAGSKVTAPCPHKQDASASSKAPNALKRESADNTMSLFKKTRVTTT